MGTHREPEHHAHEPIAVVEDDDEEEEEHHHHSHSKPSSLNRSDLNRNFFEIQSEIPNSDEESEDVDLDVNPWDFNQQQIHDLVDIKFGMNQNIGLKKKAL